MESRNLARGSGKGIQVMPKHSQHRHDNELRDLWKRRAELDEAGWNRLVVIVHEILKPYRPQILSSLPESHDIYVQEFIEDKVYRLDLRSQMYHAGTLCKAYRNYLGDKRKRLERRPKEVVIASGEGGPDSASPKKAPEPSSDVPDFSDKAVLAEIGLSEEQVARSAQAWLDRAEPWIPVYLSLNFCPDAKMSEPLYKLARRLGISNYHVKAQHLGITGNLSVSFEKTLIGRWLSEDLRIGIQSENVSLVRAALKILCFQALEWVEHQETPP
jgi:hypothetical protein